MKEYIFFFHYNKPKSRTAGKPQITVHFKKQCLIVDNVVINVPTYGHLQKEQPQFVIKGKVREDQFKIIDNIAYIGE